MVRPPSILLSRAMSWFDAYASGWDYFVPLTGSDYPWCPCRAWRGYLGIISHACLSSWRGRKSQREHTAAADLPCCEQYWYKRRQSKLLQDWVLDEEVQRHRRGLEREGNKRFMGDNLAE